MGTRTYSRSFGGGELSPEFFGRIDDTKYQTGLAACRNFVVKPHGPIENRAGFQFVREVKNSASPVRVIPFTYSTTQTLAIELGAGYFRFHTTGQTLLYADGAAYNGATPYAAGAICNSGGINYYCVAAATGQAPPNATYWYSMPTAPNLYEIPNPYAGVDLFGVHFVQSNDVLTLVHPNYPPMELRRLGPSQWTFTAIAFGSACSPPTGVGAAASYWGGFLITHTYVVTAVSSSNGDESLVSSSASCANALLDGAFPNNYNAITWTAVAGAASYRVYKLSNGLYGLIGSAGSGLVFLDKGITPDVSSGPPNPLKPFPTLGAGDYPAAVSYFEQRRIFAGTVNQPQNLWMTRSGTESTMYNSIPSKDDDALGFRVAAREANTIRHVVPLTSLLLLTSSAEWRVTSLNSDAVTPTTISVAPQSYVGANNTQPVIINNNVLYGAARGGHLRELSYSWQANAFVTGDLALRSAHLFDTYDIVDMAYQKAPLPIVWMVSSNGNLLGLTYVPEQQVGSFHRHDTGGTVTGRFESCAIVAEGNEDVLYVVVNRTINRQTKRYIECKHTRVFTDLKDAFFVDSGMTYSGAPASTISGLNWLEDETVSVLGDGAVMPQCVVTGGAITLQQPVSTAQIGLPIQADAQTLPVSFEIPGYGQGRPKNVNKAWLRLFSSSGVLIGPDFDRLTEFKQRQGEPYGSPPALVTDEIGIALSASWAAGGQVAVRQPYPLPLTLVSLSLDVEVGG